MSATAVICPQSPSVDNVMGEAPRVPHSDQQSDSIPSTPASKKWKRFVDKVKLAHKKGARVSEKENPPVHGEQATGDKQSRHHPWLPSFKRRKSTSSISSEDSPYPSARSDRLVEDQRNLATDLRAPLPSENVSKSVEDITNASKTKEPKTETSFHQPEEKHAVMEYNDDSSLEEIPLSYTNGPSKDDHDLKPEEHAFHAVAFAEQNPEVTDKQSAAMPTETSTEVNKNEKEIPKKKLTMKVRKAVENIRNKMSVPTSAVPPSQRSKKESPDERLLLESIANVPPETTELKDKEKEKEKLEADIEKQSSAAEDDALQSLAETPVKTSTAASPQVPPTAKRRKLSMLTKWKTSASGPIERNGVKHETHKDTSKEEMQTESKDESQAKDTPAAQEEAVVEKVEEPSESNKKPGTDDKQTSDSLLPSSTSAAKKTTLETEKPKHSIHKEFLRWLRGTTGELRKAFKTMVEASSSRVKRCIYCSKLPKEEFKKEVVTDQEQPIKRPQESAADRIRQLDRETWTGISKSQLKALYATVQASVARTPKERLQWLQALHRVLLYKASRHNNHDKVRAAALDGNVVLLCLKTLQEGTGRSRGKAIESDTEIKDSNSVESYLTIEEKDEDELIVTTLHVLQESSLNDSGVEMFRLCEGPLHVSNRLKTWKTLQDELESLHGETAKADAEKTIKTYRAISTLKAVYGLLFATSGEVNDCSSKWQEVGIVEYPKATLSVVDPDSPFVKDYNYVGLALGILRVLASRGLLQEDEMPQLIDIALTKLMQNTEESWVSENALALIALCLMRYPKMVKVINSKEGGNVWATIVQRCEAMQDEGHVLYQGFLCLKEACVASPDLVVPHIINAGAVQLVESILPLEENKYVEHLITTAIKLKKIIAPYNFENEEVQRYLRSAQYTGTNYTYVESPKVLSATEAQPQNIKETDKKTVEKTDEKTDEETHEKVDEKTFEKADEKTHEKTDERTREKANEKTHEKPDEKTHDKTDKKTDEKFGKENEEKLEEKTGETTDEKANLVQIEKQPFTQTHENDNKLASETVISNT